MIKKFAVIFIMLLSLPCIAAYQPLSNSPINSVEEFDDDANVEQSEFFYPSNQSQTPPDEDIPTTKDYASIYNSLQIPNFSYQHNIDPDQFYDLKDAAWAPYPLLRLNSPVYFKNQVIEPGYYLINPREHDGKWYILFKQNGLVKHIIPTYDKQMTPMGFYEKHIPKPKLTKSQKVHMGTLSFLGKCSKKSKRKEQVQCYMEINDLDNYFVSLTIYYGNYKYSTILRSVQL